MKKWGSIKAGRRPPISSRSWSKHCEGTPEISVHDAGFGSLSSQALKVLLACLLALCAIGQAQAQAIAFSFDDGPVMDDRVRMTAAQRNAAMLEQLAAAGLQSALFLTTRDRDPERLDLVRQWGLAGHVIGNHTVTHPNLDSAKVSLADYRQQVLDCDAVIRVLPGYGKRFRFTYLKEGNTPEKRDGFRAFLKSIDYKVAPVSIDASDWYYDARLRDRLRKHPDAELAPYRDAYLNHLWDRAQYYDGLSRQYLGRSVRHVILLHHNLVNALFLQDVFRMFKAKGWQLLDLNEAFADPVYDIEPQILPAGESVLWAIAKEWGALGLRSPAEDGSYEKPVLDLLGL